MLRNKIYYRLKPFIPRSVRLGVRRRFALKKRGSVGGIWPILPGSERAPEGWSGWPDGKRIAFVLTHDVEGRKGLERVRALAELEMEMGFRSSFNFVPQGEYVVPAELREWLTANGFEVGVHDLKHDGGLYKSRREFKKNSKQINRYVDDWGSVGFRSAFMFKNLEWLHDLHIQYDASTFDTDPFEPQPDGVGTIFPFWVPRHGILASENANGEAIPRPKPDARTSDAPRQGYVELPYTLPQDSTLFLMLQEKSIAIWQRKLDWIAKHGGMALVNVHPDYISFDATKTEPHTYPVERFRELLRYVRQQYEEVCWKTLPKEIGKFVQGNFELVRSQKVHNGNSLTLGRASNDKPKIWIDLDNTPHVPFFEPIIDELRTRGFPLLITARDAFQVCELADKKGLAYAKIGRHHGKNRFMKAAGLVYRSLQLARVVLREKVVLGVSHGSRSQLLLGNMAGIPTVLIEDYEFCQFPFMTGPSWVLAPSVIPSDALPLGNGRIRKYDGIKEDVYAWKFSPNPGLLQDLGLKTGELIVTVRPPATEAHYHNPEGEILFERFMNRAFRTPDVRIVLLPRNQKQSAVIRERWSEWFNEGKTIIPHAAIDGLNLMWHSDLVVSGGGTMNREAAALGVPVYSVFRGTMGAVDRHLSAESRLIIVESIDDVDKIPLRKRSRNTISEITSKRALHQVVDSIQEIAEAQSR